MATQVNDEAFMQKYGNYKPAPASVPVTTIRPIIGGETPEAAAARRAEESRQQQSAGFAAESAGRSQREEVRSSANQLRDEFNAAEPVTSYKKALPNYVAALKTGEKTGETGTGDLALVYYFAKTIDPGSAVQQGEMDNIQTTDARLPAFAQNALRELRLSNGKFTETARDGLRAELRNIIEQRKSSYLDERDRYMQIAKSPEYNVNPNIVVGETPFGERYNQEIESYWKTKEEVPAAPGAPSEPGMPKIEVAKGESFLTEADFKRRQESADAWAATKDMPFDQALAQFNAAMQAKGYGPASKETIDALQWYEKNKPGDRGAVVWELTSTGRREGGAPGRAFAVGSGLLTGVGAGLTEEIIQQFDPMAAAKLEAAKQYGREEYPGTTLASEVIGGLVSPLSKVGKAGTIAGEATRAAIYGGLSGFGEAAPDVGIVERIPGAIAGATIGGAAGGAAQKYVTPAVTQFTERYIAPVVQRAMSPATQQAIPAAEQAGIPLITSDIVKPKTWFGRWTQETLEKVPLLGTGGARSAQREAREAAITKLYDDFQAGAPEIDDITKDFLKVRGEQIGKLTREKTEVLNKVSGTPVDVTDTLAVIDAGIAKYGNLQSYQPLINKLQSFRNDLTSGDMTKIELTRKAIGDALGDDSLKPVSTELKKVVGDIYPALRQDMGRHIQRSGEAGDFAKWRSANEQLSDFATDLETSTIRRVLTKGQATPEEARSLLFSRNRSDVQKLFNGLSEEGKRNARGLIIQDMVEKAGGIDNLSSTVFTRQLKNAGKKIGVAFEPADADRLTGLLRALQFTRRADQAGVTTPTGQALIPLLAGGLGGAGAYFVPGATGLAGALLTTAIAGARVYESKAAKNVLVALSRTAPGSKAEQNVLSTLARVLSQQAGQEGGEAGQAMSEEMAPPKVPTQ